MGSFRARRPAAAARPPFSRITRGALALGLTMSLGFALVPLGCGGSETPVSPVLFPSGEPELPERTAKELGFCVHRYLGGFPPAENNRYAVNFAVVLSESGRVTDVNVRQSALRGSIVETCLGGVLLDMRLPMRPVGLNRWDSAPRSPVVAESRGLFGQAEAALSPVALLPLVIAGAVVIVVVSVVLYVRAEWGKSPTTVAPPIVTAIPPVTTAPVGTEAPIASAAPTTTATTAPTVLPMTRKYPNQTCTDEMMASLEKEMHDRCDGGYAATCGSGINKNKRPFIPCSAIKLSIAQRHICLKHRWLVQEKCFGGVPDAVHKKSIDETELGMKACELLKSTNCAKGHPMAEL